LLAFSPSAVESGRTEIVLGRFHVQLLLLSWVTCVLSPDAGQCDGRP
jgi:hypothetical protein